MSLTEYRKIRFRSSGPLSKMRRTYGMDRKGMANLSTLRTTAELAHGGVPKMMEYYDADYVANATYKERYEIEEEESHDDKGTCEEE